MSYRGIVITLAAVLATGGASAFDPDALGSRDRAIILEVLEYAQTNAPRTLPETGASIAVIRTETRPRVCRYFSLRGGGFGEQTGVGCRRGALDWEIDSIDRAVPPVATVPISTLEPPERADTPPAPRQVAPAPEPVIQRGPPAEPAATPAPPVQRVATARPTAPLPERRPGTGIPLAAAPESVRSYPTPPTMPSGRGAIMVSGLVVAAAGAGGVAGLQSTDVSVAPAVVPEGEDRIDAMALSPEEPAEQRGRSADDYADHPSAPLPERSPFLQPLATAGLDRASSPGFAAILVSNTEPAGTESLFTLIESGVGPADGVGGEGALDVPRPPTLPGVRSANEAVEAPVADEESESGDGGTAAASDDREGPTQRRSDLIIPLDGDRLAALPLPRRRPFGDAEEAGTAPAVPRPAHKP